MIKDDYEFLNDYEIITQYSTNNEKHPGSIGDRNNPQCRFYNHKSAIQTFYKKAHVAPEGIGNRRFISYYECDVCNETFGNTIEDDFNKYLGPYRTIHQIKGKKGIPTYQPIRGEDRIEFDTETNSLLAKLQIDKVELDETNKILKLKTKTQPFRFVNVYKCLLKIALTIIPEDELQYFDGSLKFLNNEGIYKEKLPVNITNTGDRGIEYIEMYLFKRNNNICKAPYILFLLRFKSLVFQTYLYINSKDIGKELTTYFLKEFVGSTYNKATRINLDMNNNDKRTDINETTFTFREIKDAPDFIKKKLVIPTNAHNQLFHPTAKTVRLF